MTQQEVTNSEETQKLLSRIAAGDNQAQERLLERHRHYLRQLLSVRMEPPLRRRVDPSDVIQETLIVADRRMDDYLKRRPVTFRLWLRGMAVERLVEHRRKHFAQRRTVARDVSMDDASSALARNLFNPRPSQAAMQRELNQQIQQVLTELPDDDLEMILLRHVEELSNKEVAELLGLEVKTASKRYGRALLKMSQRLSKLGVSL